MINSITIKNFKTINKLQNLKLNRFTEIVGQNGAGKSNLIQAINLTNRLSKGMNLEEALIEIAPFPTEISSNFNNKNEIEISLNIKSSKGNLFEYSYKISNSEDISDSSIQFISITSEILKDSNGLLFERIGENIIAIINGNKQSIPFKVKPDKLAINTYADEKVQEFSDTISSYNIINDIILDEFKLVNPDLPNLKSLDGLATALYKKRELFREAINECKEIMDNFPEPSIVDMAKVINNAEGEDNTKREEEGTRMFVRWSDKFSKKFSTYFSLSNGDIRTLFIIFSLYNAPKGSLVIIEEIENGLHKNRLRKLVELLDIISKNRGLQVIFTTHNIDIAKYMNPSNTIIVRRSGEGYSIYTYMSESEEYKNVEDIVDNSHSAGNLLESGIY